MMDINLKEIEGLLAEHKVYDAWQFVESLNETLTYVNVSVDLLERVYINRKQSIRKVEEKIHNQLLKSGVSYLTQDDLDATNIEIAGLKVDDFLFLRKTIFEFFHYTRLSIDIIIQIINTALLGDRAFEISDKKLISNVSKELSSKTCFSNLTNLLSGIKNDDRYKYLQAFDNHIKHNRTIPVSLKNSFMKGDKNEFLIKSFTYKGVTYQSTDVLHQVKQIRDYAVQTIENMLKEVCRQLPNCLDNSKRIHSLKFKQQVNKDTGVIDYISFFIEVENDLSELPNEIKILPLVIKPNGTICVWNFKIKKIFIKKKDEVGESVIGCAELKSELDKDELYREFSVRPCGKEEYNQYVISFSQEYPNIVINYSAMEGIMIYV